MRAASDQKRNLDREDYDSTFSYDPPPGLLQRSQEDDETTVQSEDSRDMETDEHEDHSDDDVSVESLPPLDDIGEYISDDEDPYRYENIVNASEIASSTFGGTNRTHCQHLTWGIVGGAHTGTIPIYMKHDPGSPRIRIVRFQKPCSGFQGYMPEDRVSMMKEQERFTHANMRHMQSYMEALFCPFETPNEGKAQKREARQKLDKTLRSLGEIARNHLDTLAKYDGDCVRFEYFLPIYSDVETVFPFINGTDNLIAR